MPRVFVTSSVQDREFRHLVLTAIAENVGLRDVYAHAGEGTPPHNNSKLWPMISQDDILLIVLGPPAGQIDQRSPQQPEELDYLSSLAFETGKPIFLFVHQKSSIDRSRYKADVMERYETPQELRTGVVQALTSWMNKNATNSFELKFSPLLTDEQVKASIFALADYFRACGGVGLETQFELQDVIVKEPEDALV